MLTKLIVGGLFCITFVMHILFTKIEYNKGRYFTKPFLMPLLLIYYILSVAEVNKLIIVALVFGFMGDVFLMGPKGKNNFILGLGSFLIGNVCYVLLFLQGVSFERDVPEWFYIIILVYVIGAYTVLKKLTRYLGDMKIPTYIYTVVILLMSFASLTRIWSVGMSISFFLPFIGSLSFLCSDYMLGFYTFKGRFKNGNIYIMLTYVLAQVLIVSGYV
ncbi:lysoplasmalogenase [Clostridium lacusfryxellense]|uniref:lysoplasmalogenase n=1 Tax=Clostridium lacusfryxellense TaxID=205328 RepID=UPI001C0DF194|nr:lysoplasmalogenase [Clostridium lacusfryxellense]MBU3112568.1 lysoplasmalogenase [Clostridium lacusfryxellense]